MALPKLAIPEYECELPVSNLKVKYRPFLVKEEKLLYLAMESQKEKEMVNAVKTIIKNCTDLKANLNKIPTFEIEYLFLRIRAKAVGEISEFTVTCPDDNKTTVDVKLPLEHIEHIFDFWVDIYRNSDDWNKCLGLLKLRSSTSLVEPFLRTSFIGNTAQLALQIDQLHRYRPESYCQIPILKEPMWS